MANDSIEEYPILPRQKINLRSIWKNEAGEVAEIVAIIQPRGKSIYKIVESGKKFCMSSQLFHRFYKEVKWNNFALRVRN